MLEQDISEKRKERHKITQEDFTPEEKLIEKCIMGKNKWDVCLMNPPYLGDNRNDTGMPLLFLHKCVEISDIVCSILPSSIITKEFLVKSPDKNERPVLNDINTYETSIDFVVNDGFDAALMSNTAIYYIDSRKENKDILINHLGKTKVYDNILTFTKYSNDDLMMEFKNIIKPLYTKDSLGYNHVAWVDKRDKKAVNKRDIDNKSDLYFLSLSAVRGNVTPDKPDGKVDDFYTFIPKDRIPEQHTRKTTYINFDSKETCYNFINYLKSDFARASLWLLKNDMNLLMFCKYVPWFDFSDPVFSKSPKEIDDYLFAKFNISDEIRGHIEEILPDYYGIR